VLGAGAKVTLFGRFRSASRSGIERFLADRGIQAVRDLTRQTTLFVVGAGSSNMIANGRLGRRLTEARARDIAVVGEARLIAGLAGEAQQESTLALARVAPIEPDLADLLNAFDLIALTGGQVRFEDADTIRTASSLDASGMEPAAIVDSLLRRRQAPRGRHRLVTDASGRAVLKWDEGTTTLSGQFMLPLEDGDSLETLFEEALDAEAAGNLDAALRLYETCARADRKDPIAPFNLGNVQSTQGDLVAARLSYERAIARDPDFAEAHFNLAGVLEGLGDPAGAARHLRLALEKDTDFAEPLFNLAQLERAAGRFREAEDLLKLYLLRAGDTPLAEKAERALQLTRMDRAEKEGTR
jgi:tetratricopeptide (TPR) repeat protein